MAENFPNFIDTINLKIQDAKWIPCTRKQENLTKTHHKKLQKTSDEEKIIKPVRGGRY